MLQDPKASALSEILVEQWMHTISLEFAEPDQNFFPSWQPNLRDLMEQEVEHFLAPIVSGAAPATDLLTANYAYADRSLATFYGLPGAEALTDGVFERVMLADGVRGGVLRQGSFLVLTSHPDSHSPTRRGKWILDRVLCVRPPPPPAVVPPFDPVSIEGGTLRQKLEATHLPQESCATCHSLIDPMGFALENYDGVGLWRDVDSGLPVDATGAMPGTGVPFNGAAELSTAIAQDPRFPNCVAKQLLTYALGRNTGSTDQPSIEALGQSLVGSGFDMPSLLEAVAQSVPMTYRQAETE
jgi:hypothetical protein